ncbi:MAG: YqiA/YcfP family alpha/beta fold hydrolase [Oscillospiraceae bacterium]
MKILNIHGYKGSSHNSAYTALKALGYEVISPDIDYDKLSPDETLDMLCRCAANIKVGFIVGSSLGGFYAAVISARLKLPVILINPCLLPFFSLPKLGYEGDIKSFIPIFGELSDLDVSITHTIVGGCDEVLNTHDFTASLLGGGHYKVIPKGKHSGDTLPLESFFGEIIAEC